MTQIFDKINQKLEQFIGLIGLVGISANVVCRFIFKISMAWSDEFLRTIFIYGYFIGAAVTFYDGDLMGLELLKTAVDKKGSKTAKTVLSKVISLINLVFFGALTYYTFAGIIWPYVELGATASTSSTPAWVITLGYGIGVLLITIIALRNLLFRGGSKE